MRNNEQENIQQHSLDVAIIAHALAVIGNVYFECDYDAERVAVMGMFHDANEIMTGDLPTPVKYFNASIKEAYKDLEEIAKRRLLTMLPEPMQDSYVPFFAHDGVDEKEQVLVRAADKISAYIKCIEERKSGNNEFRQAEKGLESVIRAMHIKEADYFMEKFVPAYGLTLDDMNGHDRKE